MSNNGHNYLNTSSIQYFNILVCQYVCILYHLLHCFISHIQGKEIVSISVFLFSISYRFHCLLSSNSYPTMEAKAGGMRRQLVRIKATVRYFLCILKRKLQILKQIGTNIKTVRGLSALSLCNHFWIIKSNCHVTDILKHFKKDCNWTNKFTQPLFKKCQISELKHLLDRYRTGF